MSAPVLVEGSDDESTDIGSNLTSPAQTPNPELAGTSTSGRKPKRSSGSGGKPPSSGKIGRRSTIDAASGSGSGQTREVISLSSQSRASSLQPEGDHSKPKEAFDAFLAEITPGPIKKPRDSSRFKWIGDKMYIEAADILKEAKKPINIENVFLERTGSALDTIHEVPTEEMYNALMVNEEISRTEKFPAFVAQGSNQDHDVRGHDTRNPEIAAEPFKDDDGSFQTLNRAIEISSIDTIPKFNIAIDPSEDESGKGILHILNNINDRLEQSLNREKFLMGRSVYMEQRIQTMNAELHMQFANAYNLTSLSLKALEDVYARSFGAMDENIVRSLNDVRAELATDISMVINDQRAMEESISVLKDAAYWSRNNNPPGVTEVEGTMIDDLTGEIVRISDVTPPAPINLHPDLNRLSSLMEDFKTGLTVMNSKLDAVTRKVESLAQARAAPVILAPQPLTPIRVQTPPRPKSVTFTSDTVFD